MAMKFQPRFFLIAVILLLASCSTIPWVQPYERANLADPIMSFDRDPIATSYIGHVYDSREGARGAGIASGGGCGCN